MKKFYIAVQVKENEKFYAYVVPCTEFDNLTHKLNINGLISASIFDTKKKAAVFVSEWNRMYREHGTYMFDETF